MKTPSNNKQGQSQQSERHEAGGIAQLIQKRAYQRYVERGQEPGHELEDWLKAEQDIRCREELYRTE